MSLFRPVFSADVAPCQRTIERYAMATSFDFEKAALRLTRGFMRRVIGITPPAQGKRGEGGALTHADKVRGEHAIDLDLARLFIGVRLKGKRPEQWPDPAAIHRKIFIASKRPGRLLPNMVRAGQGKHVDERKLAALAKDLKAAVGRLASGWLSGADAVKTTGIPAWVRRHGEGRGKHRLVSTLSFASMQTTHFFSFVASNTVVPPGLDGEMDRRINYALYYAEKAMRRETNAILARRAAEFGKAA